MQQTLKQMGFSSVADPERVEGVCANPSPPTRFKISYGNEIIWSQ